LQLLAHDKLLGQQGLYINAANVRRPVHGNNFSCTYALKSAKPLGSGTHVSGHERGANCKGTFNSCANTLAEAGMMMASGCASDSKACAVAGNMPSPSRPQSRISETITSAGAGNCSPTTSLLDSKGTKLMRQMSGAQFTAIISAAHSATALTFSQGVPWPPSWPIGLCRYQCLGRAPLERRQSLSQCIAEHFACVTSGVDPHAYRIGNSA